MEVIKSKKVAIINHIGSFKVRGGHYSNEKTDKIYLPEELSITKCFELYQEVYPLYPVSLETYRKIFNEKFNLFGYLRTDTCSECDKFQADLKGLNAQLSKTTTEQEQLEVTKKIKGIKTENAVHKMKAATFFSRNRIARRYSRKLLNIRQFAWITKQTYSCLTSALTMCIIKDSNYLFSDSIYINCPIVNMRIHGRYWKKGSQ